MRRTGEWIVIAAAAVLIAAAAAGLGAPDWLVLVLACYAGGVFSGVREMFATLLGWRADMHAWSQALVTERVADRAHRVTRTAQQHIGYAAEVVQAAGEPAAADAIRDAFARCHKRAAATLEQWRASASPELARAADKGYLEGAAMTAPSRAPRPMRRFATFEATPTWLPRALRAALVRVLRAVDVARLLHTPEIERRSLIVSLWLRAAFVLVAPLAAGGSLTGLVPFGDDTGAPADIAYVLAAGFAVATGMLGARIADYTIGQPTRFRLLVPEQALATFAVVASPCWPMAIFAAGAVNWIERPDWTLRRLLIWMALTYIPFAASAAVMGADAAEILAEIGIAIAVTAVMAGSYGLMFPATVAAFVGALLGSALWRLRAYAGARRNRRDVEAVLDAAEHHVRRLGAGDPAARAALAGLRQARDRLVPPRQLLWRRSRVLDALCSQAITAIVPPEASPSDAALKATRIVAEPPAVGTLRVAQNAVARRLERVIKRIVLEAVDNGGEGAVYSRLGILDDGRIEITIANEMPAGELDLHGFGTGGAWLHRWTAGIPGCEVLERKRTPGDRVDVVGEVFSVRLAIGRAAFEHKEEPEEP